MDIKRIKESAYILIPTGITIFSIIYLLAKKKSEEKNGFKEIPYPANTTKWPLFGHMIAFGENPSKKITEWHKEMGPIYKIKMGNQLWIMISDPFLAHEIFVKSGTTTSSRPYHKYAMEIYSRHQRGLVFRQYKQTEWKKNRKIVVDLLSPKSIDKFKDLIQNETKILISRFTKVSESKKAIYPFKELELYSMNIIMTLTMNNRFDSADDPIYTSIYKYMDRNNYYLGAVGDLGSFFPFLAWTDYFTGIDKKMRDFTHSFRDIVYEKLIFNASKSSKTSLVRDLYQIKEEKNIDEDDIFVLMNDLVSAGSDPFATTTHWSFYILSQYPEVQEKLAQEIMMWRSKNPSGAVPDFHKDREEFQYSICVQKEIMRLHPATNFGIPHMASEDTIVNGYFIPKNTVLVSSMYAMHMNPEIYKNPEVFNPERFSQNTDKMSSSANSKITERDHFVFGWGRRICPGIYLAELELFNFFTTFFAEFNVEIDTENISKPIDVHDFFERGIMAEPVKYKYRFSIRL